MQRHEIFSLEVILIAPSNFFFMLENEKILHGEELSSKLYLNCSCAETTSSFSITNSFQC